MTKIEKIKCMLNKFELKRLTIYGATCNYWTPIPAPVGELLRCPDCAHIEDNICNAGIRCENGSAFAPKPAPVGGGQGEKDKSILQQIDNYPQGSS